MSRNTPTDVGKTSAATASRPLSRKHPHGRGEDQDEAITARYALETPPRTWGRLRNLINIGQLSGNTPTDVGKT